VKCRMEDVELSQEKPWEVVAKKHQTIKQDECYGQQWMKKILDI